MILKVLNVVGLNVTLSMVPLPISVKSLPLPSLPSPSLPPPLISRHKKYIYRLIYIRYIILFFLFTPCEIGIIFDNCRMCAAPIRCRNYNPAVWKSIFITVILVAVLTLLLNFMTKIGIFFHQMCCKREVEYVE